MVEGGDLIPGRFWSRKTVLQHSISKNAEADMIYGCCGERANEVVELFVEFPNWMIPEQAENLWNELSLFVTLPICL